MSTLGLLRLITVLAFGLAFHRAGLSVGAELTVATLGPIGIGYCTLLGLAFGCYVARKLR